MATLILKNNTASDIMISDVGFMIPASGDDTYTDPVHLRLLAQSDVVHDLVSAGTITVNNGTSDLNISAGLLFLELLWSRGGRDLAIQIPDLDQVISDTQHGSRGGGTLHPAATTSVAGFMSPADKVKIDGVAVPGEVQMLQWFHLLPQPAASGTPADAVTSSASYEVKARFLFDFGRMVRTGLIVSGKLYAVGRVSAGPPINGDVRLYNATDSVELGTINFTETSDTVKSANLSQIPTTGVKIIEIHVRKNGTGGLCTVTTASCDFIVKV